MKITLKYGIIAILLIILLIAFLYYILPYKSLLGDGNPQLKVVKGKHGSEVAAAQWTGSMDYYAPINIDGVLVKSGWGCGFLDKSFISDEDDDFVYPKLCNVYYNKSTGNRCTRGPNTEGNFRCKEGDTRGSSIECSELMISPYDKCTDVTDEHIRVKGEFRDEHGPTRNPDKDRTNWNQDLCQGFYEKGSYQSQTGSICVKSDGVPNKPCKKSETMKCKKK